MRYRVQGRDEQTGTPRSTIVEAESAGEAMALAKQNGIRPKAVTTAEPERLSATDRAPAAESYDAILLYAKIVTIVGWLNFLLAPVAALVVGIMTERAIIAIGVLAGGIIIVVPQLAFAQLLRLLVQLQENTQYMCGRLYALESYAREQQGKTCSRS